MELLNLRDKSFDELVPIITNPETLMRASSFLKKQGINISPQEFLSIFVINSSKDIVHNYPEKKRLLRCIESIFELMEISEDISKPFQCYLSHFYKWKAMDAIETRDQINKMKEIVANEINTNVKIEEIVRETLQRIFWNIIEKEIEEYVYQKKEGVPEHLINLITEIQNLLIEITPFKLRESYTAEIKRSFDIDLIRQMLTYGAFDRSEFTKLLSFTLGIMKCMASVEYSKTIYKVESKIEEFLNDPNSKNDRIILHLLLETLLQLKITIDMYRRK